MSYPDFPKFQPAARFVVMGDVSNTKLRAMNGQVYSVIHADTPTSDRIQLTYRLLRNDALEYLTHYSDVDGTYGKFRVSQNIGEDGSKNTFAGMDYRSGTKDLLTQEGSAGRYRYAAPPRMNQVSRTVYQLEIELVKALS